MSIQILNAHGILSSDVPTGNLIWVDQINGVDVLAARGRMTVPFKTLQQARDAAESGDTIVVLPGTYNENDLLRNGINWHFLNGAKVHYSGGGSLAVFDTNGASVSSFITGYGDFRNLSTTGSKQVIYCAQGGSLYFEARRMVAFGECIRVPASSGTVEVAVLEDIACPLEGIHVSGNCTVKVRAHLIYCSNAAALRMSDGRCEVDVHEMKSYSTDSQDAAIRINGGSGLTSIRAFEILGYARPGLLYSAASSSTKIQIQGARIIASGSGSAGRAVDITSNVSDGVRLAGCVLIASGDYSLYAANAGTRVHLLNGLAVNKAQNDYVTVIGGDIYTSSYIN